MKENLVGTHSYYILINENDRVCCLYYEFDSLSFFLKSGVEFQSINFGNQRFFFYVIIQNTIYT